MHRLTALVTGASAGIGRSLAELFAGDGYDLVLVARRAAALEELAARLMAEHTISARAIAADLAQPDAPGQIYGALAQTNVDVVVNNTGFGLQGSFTELPLDRQQQMIQVNITALTSSARSPSVRNVRRKNSVGSPYSGAASSRHTWWRSAANSAC